MKRKIVWLVVSCLVVAALVLAACAPAAPEETEKVTPTPKVEEKAQEEKVTEEVVAPAVGEPQYGGTLVATFWTTTGPHTFDPAGGSWPTSAFTSYYLGTMLVGDLLKGPRGTGEFQYYSPDWVPDESLTGEGQLVESWEWLDPTTLVFHLRPEARWSSKSSIMGGRAVTADDVILNYERTMSSPRVTERTYWYVESVTAPDKSTVVWNLTQFWADWGNAFAWGYGRTIYPQELVKAGIEDWKNHLGISAGPFFLKDYVAASSITYEKNPNYWGTTIIDGKEYETPFIDKLVWLSIPDESTRLAALQTAKLDHLRGQSWKYKDIVEKTNPELNRFTMLPVSFAMLGMRVDTPPFDDIRVRRALNIAVDQQAIIDSFYGGNGVLVTEPYAASWPESLYTPLEKLPASVQELFSYNPEKAKQLLAEAGYPDGFQSTLDSSSAASSLDRNSMIVAYWNDIGVDVELLPHPYTTLLGIMQGDKHKQMLETGKYNGTPLSILRIMGVNPGTWNPAMYGALEEDLDRAEAIFDPVERNKLLKELQIRMLEDAPYIWLPGVQSYGYTQPWVHNYFGEYSLGAALSHPVYTAMWLDLDLREEMTGKR